MGIIVDDRYSFCCNAVIYCQPSFRRGEGFGNRLFAWARCRVFARQQGGQVISPIWFRPAMGPLVRGGIDYSSYLRQIALWGLFDTPPGDLGPVRGRWLARQYQVIHEEALAELPDQGLVHTDARILFDRACYSFAPLRGWNTFLHEELCRITRKPYRVFVDGARGPFIGINVRCGNDFSPEAVDKDWSWVGWLQKTPLAWYVRTLHAIREACGEPLKAIVVSDGTSETLAPLLRLPNVHFLRPGTAITDLLVLSRASVLLASASSTFSAWAAFLGQMPAVTAPGHPLGERGIEASKGQYLGEFDPDEPSEIFLSQVKARLG